MEIEIKYLTGHMYININEFFPTSKARINKLNKIIELDPNSKQLRVDMLNAIKQYADEANDTSRVQFKAYVDSADRENKLKDESKSFDNLVESRKSWANVKSAKEEYKKLKAMAKEAGAKYRAARNMRTAYKKTSNKYVLIYKKLQDNITYLEVLWEQKNGL